MNADERITLMLGKPYGTDLVGQRRRFICWRFCREVYGFLGVQLPHRHSQRDLTKIETTVVPCIVLFRAVADWHSGVVWPDGLHFIHACPRDIFDTDPDEYIIRKDRLTLWPYNVIIEGYYSATA